MFLIIFFITEARISNVHKLRYVQCSQFTFTVPYSGSYLTELD